MLRPDERAHLLELLRPPSGCQLDCAVGTTFSLDLISALMLPLSFAFFDWEDTDGKITANPLALLEALRRYGNRFTVFCQSGQIRLPQSSHGEFEVKASNFIWSSFHPPAIASDPRSEPFDLTRLVAERDQPHMRSASNERGTNIPLTAGKDQASETNLNLGWLGHVLGRIAHPDLPGLIRSR